MPKFAQKITAFTNPWPARLTWVAIGLAMALVIARGTMQETLRETFQVLPGSEPVPRGPGPAASIGLDLLCCLPALLVLTRRAIDKNFSLRFAPSFIPLALLCLWMLASTIWAADKFAALITACHWSAAMAILWAMCQLVRDWLTLRLVAALAFGLLPVYIIHGINDRFLDMPETIKMWEQNRPKMLAEHGFQEGSFAARQFEEKIHAGEMFGFSASPNSFGGLLSLLIVLGAGLLIQSIADRDGMKWRVPAAGIALALGLWIMAYTRSRGAFTTLGIGLLLLVLIWRLRNVLAARARLMFFAGLAIVVATFAGVVGLGITYHRLPTSTLTFRWHYWTGAASMFKDHPLLGVGWSNFGLHYLAHRLPQAPEEVKDPHSFIVRFFAELGFVGGAILIAWLVRLWWELTRPNVPHPGAAEGSAARNTSARRTSPAATSTAPGGIILEYSSGRQAARGIPIITFGVVTFVSAIACSAMLIYFIAGVDWSRDVFEVFLLLRLLFLGGMILVSSLMALRSLDSQTPDDRPAPWILYAMLLAIAGLLIHNLIDFSLFEIGPMFLFALLAGSALGIRQIDRPVRTGRRAGITLAVGIVAWLVTATALWIPLLRAENFAADADEAVRAGHFATAEMLAEQANRGAWRLNADYAFHAAQAASRISRPDAWRPLISEAITENPREESYYRFRAAGEMGTAHPDLARVKADYAAAARLDPDNVQLHLEYAELLKKLGDIPGAVMQYQLALKSNNALNREEKKRLRPEEVQEIQKKIEQLAQKPSSQET